MATLDKDDLLKLIEDDDLGLLKNTPKKSSAVISDDQRLIDSFAEINRFYKKHGKEPMPGKDVHEHKLYARLKGIRESEEKTAAVIDFDEYGLLRNEIKEINSIEDIFEDDELGILHNDDEDIFDIKHISKETTMPDYIASRTKCEDFERFEQLFIDCQAELASGKRLLKPFTKERLIKEGDFFVLKGLLLYVAHVGEREIIAGRKNARLHCIFENGTESDMLLRSLSAELYKDGRRVVFNRSMEETYQITNDDEKKGYIYILTSLSNDPKISEVQNLFKIGFSKTPVEIRIKNAAIEPTYLMAPVKIVMTFECYNLNPQKLEILLHRFFGKSCLNIDIYDNNGQRHEPREWFIAPIEVIEKAIHLVISGDIVKYEYDSHNEVIISKK